MHSKIKIEIFKFHKLAINYNYIKYKLHTNRTRSELHTKFLNIKFTHI